MSMTNRRHGPSARGLLALAHPGPAAACTAFTVMAGRSALRHSGVADSARWRRLAVAGAAMFLAQISTGSLNDYCDRAADRRFQTYKPIARGLVGPPLALGFALGTGVLSVVAAACAGASAGWLMTLGLACGWAYDVRLSRTPLSLVPFIGGIITVPWVGTAAVGVRYRRPVLMTAVAGLLGLGLHLANGGPDAARDRQAGRRSLPALLGPDRSSDLTHLILTAASLLVIRSSPHGHRGVPLLGASACLGLLAMDRRQDRTHRAPGKHPFVLPVLAAGVLAAGWLGAAGGESTTSAQ